MLRLSLQHPHRDHGGLRVCSGVRASDRAERQTVVQAHFDAAVRRDLSSGAPRNATQVSCRQPIRSRRNIVPVTTLPLHNGSASAPRGRRRGRSESSRASRRGQRTAGAHRYGVKIRIALPTNSKIFEQVRRRRPAGKVKHGTWIAFMADRNSAADHFNHLVARWAARLRNLGTSGSRPTLAVGQSGASERRPIETINP